MAWVDDRIWCHPKFTDLTAPAAWSYVKALAYCSGMSTGGVLSSGQQTMIGSTAKVKKELLEAGLWDHIGPNGTVKIHDWEDHNSKRDERRRKDRERKREMRSAGRPADSPADSLPKPRGQKLGPAHVDGSDGSDGSEGIQIQEQQRSSDSMGRLLEKLTDAKPGTPRMVLSLVGRYGLHDADLEEAREAACDPKAKSPTAVALSVLKSRGERKL